MDDSHDRHITANIKINHFFNASLSTQFFEIHLTCEIYIFYRV
jgi:hypothetical protein